MKPRLTSTPCPPLDGQGKRAGAARHEPTNSPAQSYRAAASGTFHGGDDTEISLMRFPNLYSVNWIGFMTTTYNQ